MFILFIVLGSVLPFMLFVVLIAVMMPSNPVMMPSQAPGCPPDMAQDTDSDGPLFLHYKFRVCSSYLPPLQMF